MIARSLLVLIPAMVLIVGCDAPAPPPAPVVAPTGAPAAPTPGAKAADVAPPATTSQKTL